jgi:hypothetical protein
VEYAISRCENKSVLYHGKLVRRVVVAQSSEWREAHNHRDDDVDAVPAKVRTLMNH